ncbi:MAG: hypothetical protein QOK28_103 [Actinomycetota bacterium]|jgi:hypothetical protein
MAEGANVRASPRAFICHSSADKERLVRALAARLRGDGVDVWYDEWELAVGDSLVDRIFAQGIKEADVFIVVISAHSSSSAWAREELNAAVVLRIEGQCRVMPVVLDGEALPVALKSTRALFVSDVDSYESQYDELVRAIFRASAKPVLGAAPAFVDRLHVPGLIDADATVLSLVVDEALTSGSPLVDGGILTAAAAQVGLSNAAVLESLLALDQHGLVGEVSVYGDQIGHVTISLFGVRAYRDAVNADVTALTATVVGSIVNRSDSNLDLSDLAEALGVQALLVEALIEPFEAQGLVSIGRFMSGETIVLEVSPLLARTLK